VNIRGLAGFEDRYSVLNREERNYTALLYHYLLQPGNLERFLSLIECPYLLTHNFGIYFEYSFLRDIWHSKLKEDQKFNFIRSHLDVEGIDKYSPDFPMEFNRHFGVMGEPSNKCIQYPGNWSISKYDASFESKDNFLAVCLFKWSFNIKPDIVIHTDADHAVCIEAKYESGEGIYPNAKRDKKVFLRRGLPFVKQTDLQRYMMTKLLGIDTQFWFLVQRPSTKSTSHKTVTWDEVFSSIDIGDCPYFVRDMIDNLKIGAGT
jgi:hypothetical protein